MSRFFSNKALIRFLCYDEKKVLAIFYVLTNKLKALINIPCICMFCTLVKIGCMNSSYQIRNPCSKSEKRKTPDFVDSQLSIP